MIKEQNESEGTWMTTWFASQTYYDGTFAEERFEKQTIRMIVHPHACGCKIRLKFSNLYGSEPAVFCAVNAAISTKGGETMPGTSRPVTLNDQSTFNIPAGEEVLSDPVDLEINEDVDVAISIYISEVTRSSTWHFSPSHSTYIAEGNHACDHSAEFFRKKIHSYYWLSGMEVLIHSEHFRVIVALGDSITEGSTSTPDANQSWPDLFFARLRRHIPAYPISVLNAGIVGNQVLRNGLEARFPIGGESVLSRLDRDVSSHSGTTDVIFLGGINDIGLGNATADQLIDGMRELVVQLHAKEVRIYAGTIPPFGGASTYSNEKELVRQEVNRWIRTNEVFDGILDFEAALADPQQPEQLLPAYDFGDHLHPSDAGFQALAECIPISLFIKKTTKLNKKEMCSMKTIEQKNIETVTAFIENLDNQSILEKTDQFFAAQITEAFTDRQFTVDEILAQGEKVVARIFMTGVHAGHFAGNAPTDKTVKVTQFREFHVINGQIAEHRGWFDTATLLPQIQAK
ncbi:GDSL-type esterase/lipase family protein [Paenibacillus shunpengii]|uniref:GDSL-type esterase/lipase family protein n=1 Tax=Paenibacillus shunpengii TaxID=2054424 RepID=A0ABW5SR72_9BACL